MSELSNDLEEVLIELYALQDLAVGSLPYTDMFDSLYKDFGRLTGRKDMTKNAVWRMLNNLSRKSKLENKEKSKDGSMWTWRFLV